VAGRKWGWGDLERRFSMEWLKAFGILIGRILLVLIFLQSGIGKIENFQGTAQYMASHGMPYSNFFLVGAIFFELVGSITVILGYFARFGAVLLLIFLIPTTLIFHNIFVDPKMMIHFIKNVSMFGGCLLLLSGGPGRLSLDYLLRGKKR
jgi:putative oxidoreductase